ncbi:DEAD/DEAH box helicase [Lacticaseibacillus rhamnosus]|uniref:DEAD/DEAH box helicase n=1 Tax=Lacticaseibacillus rhamnosus TaxID=47715 RepID=UPI0007E21EC5|nr:DEAD/DEAH box helicase [Lacticaseibacillus rhamnosus]OAU56900.1 DEAD/DEAH box helicase [Lacticaseibacillus rhamnosus]
MDNQFKQYQLKPFVIAGLDAMGITQPTPIQKKVIPALLRGENLVGQSQTGSGKTHAFLVPLLSLVDPNEDATQVVITAPSRELANQIYAVAQQLTQTEPAIRISRLVGGMDKQKQIDKLQAHQPHVAIGTPGRILDMIKRYDLVPASVRHFVVDEADMTLDMGFLETVDAIASSFPEHLQMAVFSATIPQKLEPFLRKYMDHPTVIELKPQSVIADTVENILIAAKGRDKNELIYQLVTMGHPFLVLIFANTKTSVDAIHDYLKHQGLKVAKIHGGVQPRERRRIMKEVADLKYQYVVATDLAARGIDIKGVSMVINAEIPRDQEFFIHRVGRTGRNGLPGTAITLYEPGQEDQIAELEHMGIKFKPKTIQKGELVDTYDRNRRVQRKPKQEDTSLAIRGLVKKAKQKHMPNYRKKIRTAVLLERKRNAKVARRQALLVEKRKHRKRG